MKLATGKYKADLEKTKKELELTVAKTEAMKSQVRSEELFAEAVKAFRGYSGQGRDEGGEDDDDYRY